MADPLVSVICLCYNHERFVKEAVESVLNQSYPAVELIIVDDGSDDSSVAVIQAIVDKNPSIKFLPLTENAGNCKAFNRGLALARGEFIIDFAADDILLPLRIEKGVASLQQAGLEFGVNFSDADWIAENGERLYTHSERFPHHIVPQGDIYIDLISRFFICSPTMIFRRVVIDDMGGYDESLYYEDFDFWIRSSRKYRYCYTPEILVKKRVVKDSMYHQQFRRLSPQLQSTLKVCEKILLLNRTGDERRALNKRIGYEIRVCLRLGAVSLALQYVKLFWRNISGKHRV